MLDLEDSTIAAISYDPVWQSQEYVNMVFESLKGNFKRDWFVDHAYHCLPLVIGNQYGFIVKSLYDFEAEWDGGNAVANVRINMLTPEEEYKRFYNLQSVNSHFGMGTFTVQMPFQLRTPNNINLMTINPPNKFIDGIYHMTGVIETDNLRRDFTYNLRLTRENHKVRINKGDPIGCVIPYPRHFIDRYTIVDASKILKQETLEAERECSKQMGIERSTADRSKPNGNGKRYWHGEDVYGNKFEDHQKGLDK